MEITSLPTESLYKFMALSGLVIIFATAAYAYKFLTAIGKQLIELETELDIFSLKSKVQKNLASRDIDNLKGRAFAFASPRLEDMQRRLDALKEGEIAPLVDGPDREEAQALLDEVNDYWNRMDKESLEIDILLAQVKGKNNLFKYETKQKDILKIGCVISVAVGVCLAYYGFSHWLVMQGYIDQGIIREALKK